MVLAKALRNSAVAAKGVATRSAAVSAAADRYSSWVDSLSKSANDVNAQTRVSQLKSVLDFYHEKAGTEEVPEIDWDAWKSEITTSGLVEQLEGDYNELQKEEYDFDRLGEVTASNSRRFEDFGMHITYNNALWLTYYLEQQEHAWNLREVGTLEGKSWSEIIHLHKGADKFADALWETHDYYPGAHSHDQFGQAVKTQFFWGIKWCKPYKHPCDAFLGLYGTNKLMHM